MKKLKKLFTNDKFFLAMVLCAVMGAIFHAAVMPFSFVSTAEMLVRVSCLVAVYISYEKHSKNVMKGMIGAVLMEQLLASISILSSAGSGDFSFALLFMVLMAALFINHFMINSDHHSSPFMVSLNQIIAILVIAVNVVWDIWYMMDSLGTMNIIYSGINIISYAGTVAAIVCVESRLDAYRLDREAAGWTEEAGYPEGYVHEYEKKDNQ